jgi:hypothetical protein
MRISLLTTYRAAPKVGRTRGDTGANARNWTKRRSLENPTSVNRRFSDLDHGAARNGDGFFIFHGTSVQYTMTEHRPDFVTPVAGTAYRSNSRGRESARR